MNEQKPAFVSLKEVKRESTLSRASIYRGVRDGTFPAPIKLGPNRVGWLARELDDWIAARVAESRPGSGEETQEAS